MAAIGNVLVKVSADIRGLQDNLKKAENRLARSGRKFSQIGNELSLSLTLPILAIGGASLQAAADFEKFEKSLESIMGSSSAAQAELTKLRKIAEDPGLSFEQAVKGSVRLQSVGLDADTARESLAQFGNALALVGGSGQDLDRVSLALGQIASKGKISAEEINQLAEVVPQIRTALKDAFGTANTEELQKMGIDFDSFIGGLNNSLSKLPRASNTFANSLENMRMAVRESFAAIGKEILTATDLQEKIQGLTNRVVEFIKWIKELPAPVKKAIIAITGILAAVGPVMKIVGAVQMLRAAFVGLSSTILGLGKAALAFVATPAGALIAALAAIVALAVDLVKALSEVEDKMGELADWAMGKGAALIQAINPTGASAMIAVSEGRRSQRRTEEAGLMPGIMAGLEAGQQVADNNPIVPSFEFDPDTVAAELGDQMEGLGLTLGQRLARGINESKGDAWIFQTDKQEAVSNLNSSFIELGETFEEFGDKFAQFTEGLTDTALALELVATKEEALAARQKYLNEFTTMYGRTLAAIKPALEQAGQGFAKFAGAVTIAIAKVAKAYIVEAIAKTIRDSFTQFGPIAGGIVAGIAAGGISVLFDSLLNKVQTPALAAGGLAFGPTMAMVGDNRGAATDPEVIAPLSKLKDYIGGGQTTGEFRIDYNTLDLLLTLREERNNRMG